MPELPEVETIRRGLAEHVCGRTITDVAVHHPRAIRHVLGGEGEFRSEILGRTIIGLGFLAGIGFTMSMFVTMLAFNSPEHAIQSKIGIFAASILGGIVGYIILRRPSHSSKKRA